MMMPDRPLYYILEGDTPVPVAGLMDWATWSADRRKRIVARTYLSRTGDVLPTEPNNLLIEPDDTHVMVSTVFLGSDHGYAWLTGDAPPILFETMIYLNGDGFLAPQWRYATATHARAMHARFVAQAQGWLRAGRSLMDVADDEWVDEHEERE